MISCPLALRIRPRELVRVDGGPEEVRPVEGVEAALVETSIPDTVSEMVSSHNVDEAAVTVALEDEEQASAVVVVVGLVGIRTADDRSVKVADVVEVEVRVDSDRLVRIDLETCHLRR